MSNPLKPEALDRKEIYRSRWVNLYVDRVRFPNGSVIEQHHLLDFDHQAVMAVVTDEAGRYLMVKVCRYPTGGAEWEFPAGSVEAGEEVLAAAKREVLEETGYHSVEHELLYSYHPLNGIANQIFHIARCCAAGLGGEFDSQEITEVRWFTEDELWQMIRANEIRDGYSLTSFLLHKQL